MTEDDVAGLQREIDEVEHRAARTVDLGARAVIISVAVFALIIGYLLPWMGTASGWEVLLHQGDAAGKAGMVPRLFAITSALFGVGASVLALITRRWGLTWVCALGSWFASVDGLLAIWTRQSTAGLTSPGPGIGLVISEIAMVTLGVLWFRTAWSRM
jgi:hypothetical protein